MQRTKRVAYFLKNERGRFNGISMIEKIFIGQRIPLEYDGYIKVRTKEFPGP